MPGPETITLTVPAAIRAVKRRSRDREPETLAILAEIDVPVASVDAARAPLVLRHRDEGPHGRAWRLHAGRLYRPLFSPEAGCPPAEAAAILGNRGHLFFRKGEDHPYGWRGEVVLDPRVGFGGAEMHRGLRSLGGHQVGEILDDGLDRARRLAGAAADDLLLIDGRLWHAAPAPTIVVVQGHRPWMPEAPEPGRLAAHRPYLRDRAPLSPEAALAEAPPWLRFAPWEAAEAAEFLDLLHDQPWHGRGTVTALDPGFDVLDRQALAGAYPDASEAAWTARAADTLAERAGPVAGRLPPAAAAALASFRDRSHREPGPILAGIEDLARAIGSGGGDPGVSALAFHARCLVLRHALFLAPGAAAAREAACRERESRFAGLVPTGAGDAAP